MSTFVFKNLCQLFDKYAVARTEHNTLVKSTSKIFFKFCGLLRKPKLYLHTKFEAADLNSVYKQTLSVEASAAVTYKVRPFLNQVGSDSQNLPVQSTWRSEHYLPSKTVKIFGKSKIVPNFND